MAPAQAEMKGDEEEGYMEQSRLMYRMRLDQFVPVWKIFRACTDAEQSSRR
jgi:hypothetical protein